jgi:hypothetical protein
MSWFLVVQQDDDLVVEVGQEFGAVGNHRFFLHFTSPDAFTMIKTVHRGVANTSDLRYVRTGPPRDRPAIRPVVVSPPAKPPPAPADPPP